MSKAISTYLKKASEADTAARPREQSADKTASIKAAAFLDAPMIGQEGTIWRRLTNNPNRELVPVLQDRMIEIAYWLWQTNPLAGWLIDVTTAFIIADGLPYEAKNDRVKEVLDGFWNDPVNRMPLNFPKHVDELHIFGELCFPAFTARQTGRVRTGYIDPAQIDGVITDPENVKMQIGVLTKSWVGEVAGYSVNVPPKKYRIILPEEAEFVLSPAARQLRDAFQDGDCFYYSINNVTNSPRGRSSLLPVADWLDAYEQYLYDYADKWPLLNSFVWDLLVDGGDAEEIKKQISAFTKKSGSVFGHNEKVTLTAQTPDLKSVEAQEGGRLFRNHILGRFGYPEHWYGGGGDVNRATASEMDAPALKILGRKQLTVKYILEDMLGYQIRQARQARYLRVTDEEAKQYSIVTPPMESKDTAKLGTMVSQVTTSLVSAEMQEWIDKDTARKVFGAIMAFAGVDLDYDEIKEALKKEQANRGAEDYLARSGKKPPELRVVPDSTGAAQ